MNFFEVISSPWAFSGRKVKFTPATMLFTPLVRASSMLAAPFFTEVMESAWHSLVVRLARTTIPLTPDSERGVSYPLTHLPRYDIYILEKLEARNLYYIYINIYII